MNRFTAKTFQYFAEAAEQGLTRDWYLQNKQRYEEVVKLPFTLLLEKLDARMGPELPRIAISARKITRPVRQALPRHSQRKNIVKDFTRAQLSEKHSSQFEWNPCLYLQFGHLRTDNFIGLGCYMVSSRQLHLLRQKVDSMPEELAAILAKRKFRQTWGGLAGELYTRFPRGYDVNSQGARFLWHRNFYVRQAFTKQEVKSRDFFDKVVHDFEVGLPFFQWVRDTVGVYRAPDVRGRGMAPGHGAAGSRRRRQDSGAFYS